MKKTKSAQVIHLNAPRDAALTAQHKINGPELASLYIVNGNGCKHYPDKMPLGKVADALFYVLSSHWKHTAGTPSLDTYSAARLKATLQKAAEDLASGTITDLQIAFAEQCEDNEYGIRIFGATVPPTVEDSYYPSTLVLAIASRGEISQKTVQPSINTVMRRNKAFGGRGYVLH